MNKTDEMGNVTKGKTAKQMRHTLMIVHEKIMVSSVRAIDFIND